MLHLKIAGKNNKKKNKAYASVANIYQIYNEIELSTFFKISLDTHLSNSIADISGQYVTFHTFI